MDPRLNDHIELVQRTVDAARRAGAEQAEAYLEAGRTFEITVRKGEIEVLKQARPRGLGLRVINDQRLGFSFTNDVSEQSVEEIAEHTVALARLATRDECLGLPASGERGAGGNGNTLDLIDAELAGMTPDRKIELAREMEKAALGFDSRVKLVEGSTVADSDEWVVLANSNGFAGTYRSTSSTLSCSVVAEQDGQKQVNSWYSNKRHFGDHEPAAEIGRRGAERAVRMLKARKIASGKYPVVFDPLTASSIVSALSGALNGEAVHRHMSFLGDKLNKTIAPEWLTIVDDGTMPRGNGSRPFDAEGVPSEKTTVVANGILKSFLYDSYTSRKVGGRSTGNAHRHYATTPHISPTNLYIKRGTHDPGEIIRSVRQGLYVTGMIGFGVDTVSGQFSRGASGIWIQNGEPAYPVQEVTIASTLQEMLACLDMIGNDLLFLESISSPTLRISEMTISGQ